MNRRRIAVAALLLTLMASAQSSKSAAKKSNEPKTLYGRNLIKNGAADSEVGEPGKVPSWTSEILVTSTYGHTSGEWDWGVEGAPGGGCCYFRLAWDGEVNKQTASQTIDLSSIADDIDAGNVDATLSAYMGAYKDTAISSEFYVAWLPAEEGAKELGRLSAGTVKGAELPEPKVGGTSMIPRKQTGTIPKGTRKATVTWYAYGDADPSGQYLALADSFTLTLTNKAVQK